MAKRFKDRFNGFVDKLVSKNYDDDYEYEDEYDDDEYDYDDTMSDYKAFEFSNIKNKTDFYSNPSTETNSSKYKSKSSSQDIYSPTSNIVVLKLQPKTFEDWRTICDEIKNGKIILLDFEGVQRDLVVRISDVIFGACYMNNTKVNYFKESILIISPGYVQIEGAYVKDEIDRQLNLDETTYDYDNIDS